MLEIKEVCSPLLFPNEKLDKIKEEQENIDENEDDNEYKEHDKE